MEQLFTVLTRAIEGVPLIAICAALLWGILSVVLSPCHMAVVPLIVGFIGGQGRIPTRRAFLLSTLFALGILITLAIVGAATAALGMIAGDVGAWGNYVVAVLLFVMGLHLLDVIPMPGLGAGRLGMRMQRKGRLAAFLLGLILGIALGPCSFAYMAAILGTTFLAGTVNWAYGLLLLLAYGVGHCSVIVAAGTSTELVQRYMKWTEASRGPVILKRVCGVLVIVGGLYLIWSA